MPGGHPFLYPREEFRCERSEQGITEADTTLSEARSAESKGRGTFNTLCSLASPEKPENFIYICPVVAPKYTLRVTSGHYRALQFHTEKYVLPVLQQLTFDT